MFEKPIIRYYWDKKKRPVGCVVALSPAKVGWSLCSKKPGHSDQIVKEVGRSLAIGRAFHKSSATPEVPKTLWDLYIKVAELAVVREMRASQEELEKKKRMTPGFKE